MELYRTVVARKLVGGTVIVNTVIIGAATVLVILVAYTMTAYGVAVVNPVATYDLAPAPPGAVTVVEPLSRLTR
jgi:hypothetical protein